MPRRIWLLGFATLTLLIPPGCDSPPPAARVPAITSASLTSDQVREHIDRELDFGYYHRQLNTKDHAAWQVMHGVLPYEKELVIDVGGKQVKAIDYAFSGGTMKGWSLERGDLLDEKTQRYGIRSVLQLGSKIGQGHPDQWLGYLQECGVTLQDVVMIGGEKYTVDDWVAQIERDVPRNPNREYSWTVMALSKYRPTTHKWIASDGKEWSLERLLQVELDEGIEGKACGGTHRMVGMTHAYNRHKEQGGKIEGVWKKVEDLILECKEGCRRYQNEDGSLSSNFFRRPGLASEIGDKLHSTGHQFEFLMVAMSDGEVQEAWVRKAALNLTDTLRKTQKVPLECGALYHALRGLALYRARMWEPKKYERS